MKADLAAMSGVAAPVVREHKKIFCCLFSVERLLSLQGGRGNYSRHDNNDDDNGFRGR